jgi:mannosyltransferase OCH1-like enzyme
VVALEGGIYSDTDVKLQVRIGKWLSAYGYKGDVNDMDFVIGMEFPHNVTIAGMHWE